MSPVQAVPLAEGSTDAYVTLAECDELCLRLADVTAWTGAGDEQRSAALVQAADEIDAVQFAGCKFDEDQVRQFPRYKSTDFRSRCRGTLQTAVWDVDAAGEVIVPAGVKLANFLQAMAILAAPNRMARLEDRNQGVASQSAGGISESYDTTKPGQVVCLAAMNQLRRYLIKGGMVR